MNNTKPLSLSDVRKAIDHAVNALEKVKEKITELNYKKFEISINENRDLNPIRSVGCLSPVGFEQSSPVILSVVIKNYCNVGKQFV